MKSLRAAYRLFVILAAVIFIATGLLSLQSFSRWRESEIIAARSRNINRITNELSMLINESEISLRTVEQWNRNMVLAAQNIDGLAQGGTKDEVAGIRRLLAWSGEVFELLYRADSAKAHEIYRNSLTNVLLNLSSEIRILHLRQAVARRRKAMEQTLQTVALSGLALVLFVSAAGLYIRGRVITPLNVIRNSLKLYGEGKRDVRTPLSGITEIDLLTDVLNRTADNLDSITTGLENEAAQRKKAETAVRRQLEEKEVLLRETHHRIKNNFASIAGLLSLQAAAASSPEAAAALNEAMGRVNSMQILYGKMLMADEYKNVPAGEYLSELADSAVSLYAGGARVRLDKNFDSFTLSPKRLFPLGIILNELLTNAMKYAFKDGRSGTIGVSALKNESGERVVLLVTDDGVGLPEGLDVSSSTGFGFMLTKMLCDQMDAELNIETGPGTRCSVAFKL